MRFQCFKERYKYQIDLRQLMFSQKHIFSLDKVFTLEQTNFGISGEWFGIHITFSNCRPLYDITVFNKNWDKYPKVKKWREKHVLSL